MNAPPTRASHAGRETSRSAGCRFLTIRGRPAARNVPRMSGATEGQAISPQPILEAAWGFAITRVLATAVELDLFTSIASGHDTVGDLANDSSCSVRGLSMLLHAL